MKIQKIIRHGNSLALVIPRAMLRETGIQRGDFVTLQYTFVGTEKKPNLTITVAKLWKTHKKSR